MAERIGLVLNAGGARGAYQLGALAELLPALAERGQRPTVLVGTSAGALSAVQLAATAHLPVDEQVAALLGQLRHIEKAGVFRPLWQQLPLMAMGYGGEMLQLPIARLRGLLGTAPLTTTLDSIVDWSQLHANIADGTVDALAVNATVVRSGQVVAFTETSGELPEADPDGDLVYASTSLGVEHAMASAAIPMLFPSIRVRSPAARAGWYVDGATRLRSPLKPALELGADRLLIIGTTSLAPKRSDAQRDSVEVDLGDGAVTLLNAMIDDALRRDVRRLGEVNGLAEADEGEHREALHRYRAARGLRPFRTVPYAVVTPGGGSEIPELALEVYRRRHGRKRALLRDPDFQVLHRLLGGDSPLQGELLSFLLFDGEYFDRLVEIGSSDARQWLDDHPDLWQTGPMLGGRR